MIRVVIVAEVGLLRRALREVLLSQDDMEVIADVSRIEEGLAAVRTGGADAMVVDLDDGGEDTLRAVRRLGEEAPDCAILTMSATPSPDLLQTALRAGVRGFVGKDLPPEAMLVQIRAVVRGEFVVDPAAAVAALNPPPCPLTAREREVLRAAAEGLPLKEIARRLYLAHGTVRNHLSTIMRKTGTRNRLEALRKARKDGWI